MFSMLCLLQVFMEINNQPFYPLNFCATVSFLVEEDVFCLHIRGFHVELSFHLDRLPQQTRLNTQLQMK